MHVLVCRRITLERKYRRELTRFTTEKGRNQRERGTLAGSINVIKLNNFPVSLGEIEGLSGRRINDTPPMRNRAHSGLPTCSLARLTVWHNRKKKKDRVFRDTPVATRTIYAVAMYFSLSIDFFIVVAATKYFSFILQLILSRILNSGTSSVYLSLKYCCILLLILLITTIVYE